MKKHIFKIIITALVIVLGLITYLSLYLFGFIWWISLTCLLIHIFIVIKYAVKNKPIKKYISLLIPLSLQIIISITPFPSCDSMGALQDSGTDYSCECSGIKKYSFFSSQCIGIRKNCHNHRGEEISCNIL